MSCEYQKQFIKPLNIKHYCGFDVENKEIQKCDVYLLENGSIDLCVLELGLKVHLGFNELSDDFLKPFSHKVQLSETSLKHSMILEIQSKPEYGLTLQDTKYIDY